MAQNTETAVMPPTVEQSAITAAARRMRNHRSHANRSSETHRPTGEPSPAG
jgi:hypothetical protein